MLDKKAITEEALNKFAQENGYMNWKNLKEDQNGMHLDNDEIEDLSNIILSKAEQHSEKDSEKWRICQKCFSIANFKEELDEIENSGGMGMCDCEFMVTDENGDVWFPRIFNERIPLTRELLDKHDNNYGRCEGHVQCLEKPEIHLCIKHFDLERLEQFEGGLKLRVEEIFDEIKNAKIKHDQFSAGKLTKQLDIEPPPDIKTNEDFLVWFILQQLKKKFLGTEKEEPFTTRVSVEAIEGNPGNTPFDSSSEIPKKKFGVGKK